MTILKRMMIGVVLNLVCPFTTVSALDFGVQKEPVMIGETQWYSVYYKDDQRSIVVNMPGEPSFIFREGKCYIRSGIALLDEAGYEVTIGEVAPNSLEKIITSMNAEQNARVTLFEPSPSSMGYAAEIQDPTESYPSITRIYVTSDNIYFLEIEGRDWSLADDFFNSFKVEEQ